MKPVHPLVHLSLSNLRRAHIPEHLLDELQRSARDRNLIVLYHKRNRSSLRSLLTYLEARGELKHWNLILTRDRAQLMNTLNQLSSGVVLISAMTPQRSSLIPLLRELKAKTGEFNLIGGGPHATGAPIDALELGFDLVALGEGELSLLNLLRALRGEEVRRIGSWAYKLRGEHGYTGFPPEMVSSLDEVPAFSEKLKLYGPIEITRGCPWRCPFCQTSLAFGPVRHRSLEDISRAIEAMLRDGLRDVRFITPNALSYGSPDGKAINEEALLELLKLLRSYRERGARFFLGSFPSELRPEGITERIVEELRSSVDNESVIIGLQSGSERILKMLNRLNLEEALETIKLLTRAGFKVDVDVIFGFPFETDEDLVESLRTYEVLSRIGARVHAHYFMPLPGTPYQNLRPRELPNWFIRELGRLASERKLFGSWERQIELAREMIALEER